MTISAVQHSADKAIINQTTCKAKATAMRKKITGRFTVWLGLILTLAGVNHAQAGECVTTVLAGIVLGEHWTVDKSPYCILGDISMAGVTIDPGVQIWIDGDFTITLLSTVIAEGTAEQPILFTEKDPGDGWNGVFMQDAVLPISLKHCIIEEADTSGLRIINSSPTVEDCIFRNNTRIGDGGGVHIDNSSNSPNAQLTRCTIENNTATGHGGGIRAFMGDGELSLVDCILRGNFANSNQSNFNAVGGGLYVVGSSRLEGCRIQDNTALGRQNSNNTNSFGRGGGVFFSGDAILENCIVHNNLARAENPYSGSGEDAFALGGGIYISAGELTITSSIVSCNSTTGFVNGNDTVFIRGSGLYLNAGSASMINCTIAYNSSQSGIYRQGGTLDLMNSIVYFNDSSGIQIFGTATVTYSNVQGCPIKGEGNICSTPVFASDDCSCPDFRILPFSPCIDAGNPLQEFDDGCLPPGLGTATNDMGAHGGPSNCKWDCWIPADLNCDGQVGVADLLELLAQWGPCPALPAECPADITCDGTVGVADLLRLLDNWG